MKQLRWAKIKDTTDVLIRWENLDIDVEREGHAGIQGEDSYLQAQVMGSKETNPADIWT